MSRNIRSLAFEFEISIIVLSQVARSDEGRDSGLSTLGESGALEQDADIVIFLNQENRGYKGGDSAKVKVIVAKNKHGALLVLKLGTLRLSLIGLEIESNTKKYLNIIYFFVKFLKILSLSLLPSSILKMCC
ncbi:DnaB-like helicase C-terminal domain-containing protein [Borreliella bavariensis]|uniref:DnaB-like helicase C-terminal domain-containing protein n=1 Tax=Borreliella bavariensis TaxID=664662 RepID=UPI00165DE358|nr:DnaB-like helicase C-terminal domain-containing protein [Borreliella bavariensis]